MNTTYSRNPSTGVSSTLFLTLNPGGVGLRGGVIPGMRGGTRGYPGAAGGLSRGWRDYPGPREVMPGMGGGTPEQRRSPPGPPGSLPAAAPPRKRPLAAEQDPGAPGRSSPAGRLGAVPARRDRGRGRRGRALNPLPWQGLGVPALRRKEPAGGGGGGPACPFCRCRACLLASRAENAVPPVPVPAPIRRTAKACLPPVRTQCP